MAASMNPPPGEQGKPKPANTMPIGLASLWRAIRRYSLLVFVFVLLSASAGALVYFFLPLPAYTARVIYHVKTSQDHILNPNAFGHVDPGNFRALQAATLTRYDLLNAALADPVVATQPMFLKDTSIDAVQLLQSKLKVDWSIGSEHMRVSLEGDSPEELQTVLKAVHAAYNQFIDESERQSKHKRLSEMQDLQTSYNNKAKAMRQNIRNVLTNFGSADPQIALLQEQFFTNLIGHSMAEMQRMEEAERALDRELIRLEKEQTLPAAMRGQVPPDVLDAYVTADPRLQQLRMDLETVLTRLEKNKDLVRPDKKPTEIMQLEQRKKDLEENINSMKAQLREAYAKHLREEMLKGQATMIDGIKARLERIRDQKADIDKQYKAFAQKLEQFKGQNAQVEDLRMDLKNLESITEKINDQLVLMQTEAGTKPRVTLWEPPRVLHGIEGNRRVKYTAMATIGFLVLGLALAQWLEIRHRRIQTLDEVTSGLGLQVLGTVPAVPKSGGAARSNWPHLLTEAVNTTRTMLLAGPSGDTNKTLLVTSAMSGEGKTSLTTHLAVSLASAGRRVLLIDADMRRPAVHKVLGLTSKPGLAELLMGTAVLDKVTLACKINGLYLVPAGQYTREAAAALSTERWQNVLRECGSQYDFVLVDSPPILPVADALAIAKNVDGVLISVMQDLSRFGAVQTACQRLSMIGANILGVVVSGVKTTGGYYYYYYDERYSKPVEAPPATPTTAAVVVRAEPQPPPAE